MLRAVLQQTGTVGLCLLGKCFLAKRTEDPAACPRRKNVQRLDPHVDCCGIALRRPVQKPVSGVQSFPSGPICADRFSVSF